MIPSPFSTNAFTSRRGFTLVELLVVIAIISLLAAIALKSLTGARAHGQRAVCLSNERQLALAVLMFADDNNGEVPCFFGGTVVTNGGGNGIHLKVHLNGKWAMPANVGPVRSPGLMLCPTDKAPATFSMLDVNNQPVTVKMSYAYNYELYMTRTKATTIANPAGTVILMDGNEKNNVQNGVWWAAVNPGKAYKDIDRFNQSIIARRHHQRFNAVFLDGHVEWLKDLRAGVLLPGYQ